MSSENYKLSSIEKNPKRKSVSVKGVSFGADKIQIIAGPCSVESEEQLFETAKHLKDSGVKILRAGAFKPRTHPYSFQGLGSKGLDILNNVGSSLGMITETEVLDTRHVAETSKKVDIIRVGARNMQNFELLKELGKVDNPVILKNGIASTYEEFICAAEYILEAGNENVILCWRGIRSFEPEVRFSFDALSVPILKSKTNLPVIADPSHPAGKREFVLPLSKSLIASGADGILVEAHNDPLKAMTDASQQIKSSDFPAFISELKKSASSVDREIQLF
jgi:3-deoxy-7-phosphoheptulonate synthase